MIYIVRVVVDLWKKMRLSQGCAKFTVVHLNPVAQIHWPPAPHNKTKSLSFYVNCYFQSDSLKSNSLTSEAEDGCHKVVFGLKMIS